MAGRKRKIADDGHASASASKKIARASTAADNGTAPEKSARARITLAASNQDTPPQTAPAYASRKRSAPPAQSAFNTRMTRGMTTCAARNGVFQTAELLESIMLNLPIHTIIASQRVCRLFKAQVEGSTKLQEKMFRRLSGQGAETWKSTSTQPYATWSDPQWIRTAEAPEPPLADRANWSIKLKNFLVPAHYNPLFRRHAFCDITDGGLQAGTYMETAIKHALLGRSMPLFRDMFLTDPPLPIRAMMTVFWDTGKSKAVSCITLQNSNTIGDFLAALLVNIPAMVEKPDKGRQPNEKTTRRIMEEDQPGKKLRLSYFEMILHGILLPSDEERSACLPLP